MKFAPLIILIIALLLFNITGCTKTNPPTSQLKLNTTISDNNQSTNKLTDSYPTKKFAIRAFRHSFDPNIINVSYGDIIELHLTSMDVGHGFALVDFGINKKIPAQEKIIIKFKADKKGIFPFFSSVYSGKGYKNMTGKLIVN